MIGWMTATAIQIGVLMTSSIWRWKTSHTSWASVMASRVPQRAAGLGQEHVVQARPVQFERAKLDARAVQRPHDLLDRGGPRPHPQAQAVGLLGFDDPDIGLARQHLGRLHG